MRNWKEEIFDGDAKIVYVNYERREGVTSGILKEILKRDYKEILVDGISRELIKETYSFITGEDVLKSNSCKIVLKNNNGNEINIYFGLNDNSRGRRLDLIVIDSNHIVIPAAALSCDCKIICVLPDRENVKVINSDNKLKKIILNKGNRHSLVDFEIDKLLQELSTTKQSENTTMTRERLISMINKLVDIKDRFNFNKAGGNIG